MWSWAAIIGEVPVSVGVAGAAVDAAVQLYMTKRHGTRCGISSLRNPDR
jgi:hypothetical protein